MGDEAPDTTWFLVDHVPTGAPLSSLAAAPKTLVAASTADLHGLGANSLDQKRAGVSRKLVTCAWA
jgi:hypothetical protein